MKEIVWVFGNSASGKATFIRRVVKDTKLHVAFGWKAMSVAGCEASLKYIGQSPIAESREEIIDQVASLLNDADVVLIKWQLVDSLASRLTRLQQKIPEAEHRIIRLEASRAEMIRRLQQKTWWYDYGKEDDFIDSEIKSVEESIDSVKDTFAVTRVSSEANDDYSIIG